MQDDFAGRIALVTGAASGIGEALVRQLAARGAQVLAADIDGAAMRVDQGIGGGGGKDGAHGFVGLDEETPAGKFGVWTFQRFDEHALAYEMLRNPPYHCCVSVPVLPILSREP